MCNPVNRHLSAYIAAASCRRLGNGRKWITRELLYGAREIVREGDVRQCTKGYVRQMTFLEEQEHLKLETGGRGCDVLRDQGGAL